MVALPSSVLYVPNIKFSETNLGATTNLFLFPKLRPALPAPRARHGYQIVVGGGYDTDETQTPDGRLMSGGTGGAAATLKLVFVGSTFNQYTQNLIQLPMTVNSKADEIYVIAITQASTDIGGLRNKVKELLADALAGTAPDAADGLVFTKNGASRDAIKTAMRLFFGTDPDAAFVDTVDTNTADDTIVFTAGAVGADGNNQFIGAAILAGPANLSITFGDNNEPLIAGIGKGRSLGGTKDFNDSAAPTIVDVTYDNTPFDFGSGIVGLKATGTFIARQRDNPFIQALLTNSYISFGPQNSLVMPGDTTLRQYGLVAVHPSATAGQVNFDVLYEVQFTKGRERNFAKEGEPGIPVGYTAVAMDSADAVGFSGYFRQFAS